MITVHLNAIPDPEGKVILVRGVDYPVSFEADTIDDAVEQAARVVPEMMEANGDGIAGVEIVITEFVLVPRREIRLPVRLVG